MKYEMEKTQEIKKHLYYLDDLLKELCNDVEKMNVCIEAKEILLKIYSLLADPNDYTILYETRNRSEKKLLNIVHKGDKLLEY